MTIAAILITAIFHKSVTKNKPLKIKAEVYQLILGLLTQKVHVHGLVLYDVVDMVTNSIDTKESKEYLTVYFNSPFTAFEIKIKEVIDANKNLDIDARLERKFKASVRELAEWLKELEPLEEKTLVDVICEAQIAINYGIGKSDFNTIKVPQTSMKLEKRYKELNKKRMSDEAEIIKKLKF